MRIRSIKPQFFRHELLQELQEKHCKLNPMLVFAGLWGCCDKYGRFEWNAKTLKLDILPFMEFKMEESLNVLWFCGLINRYEIGGKTYGEVPSFSEHQRISGTEKMNESRIPAPKQYMEASGKHSGSTRESPDLIQGSGLLESGKQSGRTEGKGREKERNIIPSVQTDGLSTTDPFAGSTEPPAVDKISWPKSWAYDTSEIFKKHDVIMSVGVIGTHVKTLKGSIPWSEWTGIVERMAKSGETQYGLPALLRNLKKFREEEVKIELDANGYMTAESQMALIEAALKS